MLTRRAFLWRSGMALTAGAVIPSVFERAAGVAEATQAAGRYGADTILVVVQMGGGNDGLNTVVPYGLDGYRQARPNLAIADSDVLPLDDRLGLHPALGALHRRFQDGQVAIVQGVGYPEPDLSHSRSMQIWQTAAPDRVAADGWLADYVAVVPNAGDTLFAASVTSGTNPALVGRGVDAATIANLESYRYRPDPKYPNDGDHQEALARRLYALDYGAVPLQAHVARTALRALASSDRVQEAARSYATTVAYPNHPLANSLKTVAQLIAAEVGTRVYSVGFSGFDTHAGQANVHARQLGGFADSVDAFLRDVTDMGKVDRVLLMAFSEFGRRVRENGSQGTDHGTAGPMFLLGTQLSGGLYGAHPSLQALDGNGNLRYGVDFRAVYATAIEGWMGADAQTVLGGRYESVGFV
jgi:uncharacterized protein (DUF1501 family)